MARISDIESYADKIKDPDTKRAFKAVCEVLKDMEHQIKELALREE